MSRNAQEQVVQFMVSPDVKRAIKALALERDETIRTLILRALRDAGLSLDDIELIDRRKAGNR